MGAQHAAFGIIRSKGIDDFCPQQSRGAHLGNFHIEVHADAPEKTQAGCKIIDLEACSNRGLDVFLAIGEGVGELQCRIRPGFLYVVARDRDGVELGQIRRTVGDNVPNNTHAGGRWVNVGVAHHEFFEDVILDRAGER